MEEVQCHVRSRCRIDLISSSSDAITSPPPAPVPAAALATRCAPRPPGELAWRLAGHEPAWLQERLRDFSTRRRSASVLGVSDGLRERLDPAIQKVTYMYTTFATQPLDRQAKHKVQHGLCVTAERLERA
jgi:hypothetical protein